MTMLLSSSEETSHFLTELPQMKHLQTIPEARPDHPCRLHYSPASVSIIQFSIYRSSSSLFQLFQAGSPNRTQATLVMGAHATPCTIKHAYPHNVPFVTEPKTGLSWHRRIHSRMRVPKTQPLILRCTHAVRVKIRSDRSPIRFFPLS